MAVFQKNDPEQARRLAPFFDGVLDEQCNQYAECASFRPYLAAGKPVLNAEYRRRFFPGFLRRRPPGRDHGRALRPRLGRFAI